MFWRKNRDNDTANGRLAFDMPEWLIKWERKLPRVFARDEEFMDVAIAAAALNVREKTGGPFGAVVVDANSGTILSVGVNLVVPLKASVMHAEIVALLRAQNRAATHRLGKDGERGVTLYTSAEPCAMCMGAIPWSGVKRLVCGATDADVRSIGFDEGDKPAVWEYAYSKRGIAVETGVMRAEAVKVLTDYRDSGGEIY